MKRWYFIAAALLVVLGAGWYLRGKGAEGGVTGYRKVRVCRGTVIR